MPLLSLRLRCLAFVVLALAGSATADPVHIAGVQLVRRPYARWTIYVDLEHEDTSHQDYTDRVDVLDQDGRRVLIGNFFQPRWKDVEEDGPLRRRLRPMRIPEGATKLTFRGHCKLSGWGGRSLVVDLARTEGPGYAIGARGYKYLPHLEGIEKNPNLRTWRKRLLSDPPYYPHPPQSPVPPVPPDPVDRWPQARDRARIVRYPVVGGEEG